MKQKTIDRIAASPGGLKEQLEGRNAEIVRLRAALELVRDYIHDQPIANAIVPIIGKKLTGKEPSLIQTIDTALRANGQLRKSETEG
jgi:hypothetical protein